MQYSQSPIFMPSIHPTSASRRLGAEDTSLQARHTQSDLYINQDYWRNQLLPSHGTYMAAIGQPLFRGNSWETTIPLL